MLEAHVKVSFKASRNGCYIAVVSYLTKPDVHRYRYDVQRVVCPLAAVIKLDMTSETVKVHLANAFNKEILVSHEYKSSRVIDFRIFNAYGNCL